MTDEVNVAGKAFLESKTFWGLVIALGVPFAAKHGVMVDATGMAADMATYVGGLLALWGRHTATGPLALK